MYIFTSYRFKHSSCYDELLFTVRKGSCALTGLEFHVTEKVTKLILLLHKESSLMNCGVSGL